MADRNKVKSVLEFCVLLNPDLNLPCDECPYKGHGCLIYLARDIRELLDEMPETLEEMKTDD